VEPVGRGRQSGGRRRQYRTALVAKAAPDGYTILLTSGAITISVNLQKNAGFTMKELVPVTNVATGPMIVVVNPRCRRRTCRN
jgi:tripartite-type tricarboxylate transporter receptor subunit TctC